MAYQIGAGGGIRTPEGVCRQIYSLLCLTAPQPQRNVYYTKTLQIFSQ